MKARLLIVDRDERYREWLRHHLGVASPEAEIAAMSLQSFTDTRESFARADCDLLLLATHFGSSPEDPDCAGLELLRQLRDQGSSPAVIVLAEDGNELTAVRALQLGAADYLPKRLLTPERLHTAVRLALRRVELRVAEQAGEASGALRSLRDPIPGYTIR